VLICLVRDARLVAGALRAPAAMSTFAMFRSLI
jgi:hypothetical protein